jgi:PAS domain S-box-containing protein
MSRPPCKLDASGVTNSESALPGKNGSHLLGQLSVSSLKSDTGLPLILAIVEDVTEKKATEIIAEVTLEQSPTT